MSSERIQKAEAIISRNAAHTAPEGVMPYCVLALLDENGYPTASTLTAAKADGLKEITFCTGLESRKARRIERSGLASVCFSAPDYNITLVGDIEIITDPQVKRDCWYGGLENHFSNVEDPNYCVLRFRTKRYRLFIDWVESDGSL